MSVIHRRRWPAQAGAPARAAGVYLLHGRGEHSGCYERLADALAVSGWVVGAHDHPGHGHSGGTPGLQQPPGALATQAAIQIEQFARETGSRPVLFGHSLGGVLALELHLAHWLPIAALILSAPALLPQMGALDRMKLEGLSRLAPDFRINRPLDATWLTHDADEARRAQTDDLRHGWLSAGLIKWLVDSGERSLEQASDLTVDTLMLVPEEDRIARPAGFAAFSRSAPAGRLTVQRYAGAYHELFNEVPALRERATADVIDWLGRLRLPQ